MISYEFWRERRSGGVWAVQLRNGMVIGCCGPLLLSEVDPDFLQAFRYSPDRAAWLEAHRGEFDYHDVALAGPVD